MADYYLDATSTSASFSTVGDGEPTQPESRSISNILSIVFGLLVIINNLVPIAAILRYRWLRSPSNYLVLSLSVTDLLMGMVIVVFDAALKYTDNPTAWRWSIVYFYPPLQICIAVTAVSMLLMAIDRVLAVHRPLAYKHTWTRRRVCIAILLMWLYFVVYFYTIGLTFGLHADPMFIRAGGLVALHIPFVFMLIPIAQVLLAIVLALVIYIVVIVALYRRYKLKLGQKDEADTRTLKATKLMLGLFVILVVTWMPSMMFFATVDMRRAHAPWVLALRGFINVFFLSGFMFNPLMYPWMSQDFRRAYRQLFRCPGSFVHPSTDSGANTSSGGNTSTSRY